MYWCIEIQTPIKKYSYYRFFEMCFLCTKNNAPSFNEIKFLPEKKNLVPKRSINSNIHKQIKISQMFFKKFFRCIFLVKIILFSKNFKVCVFMKTLFQAHRIFYFSKFEKSTFLDVLVFLALTFFWTIIDFWIKPNNHYYLCVFAISITFMYKEYIPKYVCIMRLLFFFGTSHNFMRLSELTTHAISNIIVMHCTATDKQQNHTLTCKALSV